jgi:Ca2+-binding RTX toxin-like protein
MNGTVQNFSQGIINRLQIDAGAGNDSLTLSIPKGVLANRITAMINGGPGNDVLAGGAEADFFEGIAKDGSDTMTGGDGLGDAVFYTTRTNPVSVTLDGKANDGEAGENDMVGNDIEFLFGGSGKDTLSAGPYSETIVGGAGNDELTGGPQSDFLVGSGGNDTTYGGKGTDYFKLSGDGASDRYNIGPVDPGQPTTDQLAIDPTASGDLFKDRPI